MKNFTNRSNNKQKNNYINNKKSDSFRNTESFDIIFKKSCRRNHCSNHKCLRICACKTELFAGDFSALEQEIANYEKQLRQNYSVKAKIIEEIDTLDPDDRHYIKRKADLDDRLYKMYDKIEDTESLLIAARAKKTAIEAEKLTADNICKVLICFDKLYAVMDEYERRKFMESLVSEVHVYEERKPNGQWLKSIKFNLPIIEEDMEICLDNETHVETAAILMRECWEK